VTWVSDLLEFDPALSLDPEGERPALIWFNDAGNDAARCFGMNTGREARS
jgi:hypothetical protein